MIGLLPGGAGVPDLAALIEMVLRTIEAVGVDHIAIGTDMDYTFRSTIPTVSNGRCWWQACSKSGLAKGEVAKIIGGNFLRVLGAATATGE